MNEGLQNKPDNKVRMAQLTLDTGSGEQVISMPIIEGTEKENALDISSLRAKTGYVTIDPAFMNTASTTSAITFLDGDKGTLQYRGYPIDELGASSTFLETSYLIIHGNLPTSSQLSHFEKKLAINAHVHENFKKFLEGFPPCAHPMAKLSALVCSLSAFDEQALDVDHETANENAMIKLLAQVPTLAAFSYKKSVGQPFVYPDASLSYCANFLNMMFLIPGQTYALDEEVVKALNLLFILHADHEQNCSTSTVRFVGSSKANLYASISAGICALWGPLHGGANQEVIEMLEIIHNDGGNVQKFVDMAKDKSSNFKIMGFGHRVYKNYDPRARLIKSAMDAILAKLGVNDPLLEIAKKLEEAALKDSYFVERKLYPNVDFYSGIIYRALGFPTNMFPVLFALGRMPGWIAHWKEMHESPSTKIGRPRQIYTGPTLRSYLPISKR